MRGNAFRGRQGLILVGLAGLALGWLGPVAQEKDAWAPLQFLVGQWEGVGSGEPGEGGSGASSFAFDLDRQVLVRTNRAEYPAKPGEKAGIVHKDLLIVYRQASDGKFRAIYFDNEGHVINYDVSFPSGQPSVVFESEASGKGPRFRLVYGIAPAGVLSVEFFIAPPGGEFKSYVKGLLKKKP